MESLSLNSHLFAVVMNNIEREEGNYLPVNRNNDNLQGPRNPYLAHMRDVGVQMVLDAAGDAIMERQRQPPPGAPPAAAGGAGAQGMSTIYNVLMVLNTPMYVIYHLTNLR